VGGEVIKFLQDDGDQIETFSQVRQYLLSFDSYNSPIYSDDCRKVGIEWLFDIEAKGPVASGAADRQKMTASRSDIEDRAACATIEIEQDRNSRFICNPMWDIRIFLERIGPIGSESGLVLVLEVSDRLWIDAGDCAVIEAHTAWLAGNSRSDLLGSVKKIGKRLDHPVHS